MITTQQVGWAKYSNYEGPWFRGLHSLPRVEATDNFEKKVLAVITATEGGHFDAINMYDRMICSVGLIQWGDAGQYSVCDMLGRVQSADPSALNSIRDFIGPKGYSFGKTAKGWRFFTKDYTVDSLPRQQALYLGGSSGLKGQWTESQKAWARGFLVALQAVWDNSIAQEMQLHYTLERLTWFATPPARASLFEDVSAKDADPNIVEAARAAFLSFAANLPTVAASQLQKLQTSAPKWSSEWLSALLKQLTFGPQIAIYPIRYDAIRPVIERLWGVELPDTSKELSSWQEEMNINPKAPEDYRLDTPLSIQKALAELGYELGPSGADGIMGPKTSRAVAEFQATHHLNVDGIVGPRTLSALRTELMTRRSA